MISLTGAALFLIQLLVVCQVFADILPQIPSFDQRNILVPRGDSITLTCNISMANVTQINWTKGRSVFAHSVLLNQTITNFTSHYIIDVNLPSKLNISNVQHDDAGLYRCDLTDIKGQRTIEWNLTVSEKPEEILPFDQRNILVPRGDSIILTCNISNANVTQINWTKGRSVFAHSVLLNQTSSNFTSHYIIDVNLPSKLNIPNVQHDDAGLYRCHITNGIGQRTIEWNLTVSEKPEGQNSLPWYFPYILTAVIGSLLCLLTPAVCLSRKNWTKTQNQDQDSRTLSCAQYQAQLGREVAPLQPHSCAEYRTNHQQRESVLQEAQYEAE
ncbi:neural cell adhesion molecule 1-like isoform X4 [Epinephelus fuscoguttatus]|uniref:neural cell adhesion molecule 1-like isoform X2 n=1 Tax=Epinephelus fuscoguttatus TaxID=293821 RepID=UPI0020D19AB0|nr:neural cell adhesion molecule 1-like isoform X2 [Epinephelus fuscoguttatus]XP_049450738.1 neural cell adhesion molecule 1-like isoform X4 [Epinephelus fuscoguttatus]